MIPIIRTLFGLVTGLLATRLLAVLTRLHVAPAEARRTSRRTFTRNATLGAVGVVLAELTAGTVWMLWPNKTGAFGSELTVPRANVPPVNGTPFVYVPGKFYVAHTEDGVLALYWKCPHLGCTVPWRENEGRFHCPCHGSIYLYNGVRIAGPAPRPLDLMQVTVVGGGDLKVHTGQITQRSDYTPQQAVPYPV